jgi:hypothetical protein
MNNTSLLVACTASVAGCLGAAYLVDKISPVPAIRDKDILETTSVAGIATLTKSAVAPLVQNSEDPKEIFTLYLAKTITLEDALEMLLKKGNDAGIKDLYTSLVAKRDGFPEESDERAYYDAFKKALEKYYPDLRPAPSVPPVEETPTTGEEILPSSPPVEDSPSTAAAEASADLEEEENPSQVGGQRRRRRTQKSRHPVIRSVLCADT